MSYEITIKRIENVTKTEQGKWTTVDSRPWLREELVNEGRYYQNPESFLESNPVKSILGHTPDREVIVKEETEVLRQTVEALDLAAVIRAINNL
jgi:hypothetical protein